MISSWRGRDVPGFDATATKYVTVDGYAGKQIEFTATNHNQDQCK